jgi:hypothetical protein
VIEIAVNISVVKLDTGENHVMRTVVKKLWPFIEKRRIVFVAFDDHVFAGAAVPAAAEIDRHPADEKARIQSGAR